MSERTLIDNATHSCGVCDDTGLVDHDDGDAYGCTFCLTGQRKIGKLYLKSAYMVNDITPAVRKPAVRLDIAEYAQTPAGKRDPHLDTFRKSLMAARRAQKEEPTTHDRRHPAPIPPPRAVLAHSRGGPNAQRVLRDGEVGAEPGVPVDGPGSADADGEDGGAGPDGEVAGH